MTRKQRVLSEQAAAVLALMLERPQRKWYGFRFIKEIGITSGTLYPILARLEKQGVLTSSWELIDSSAAGRPQRRFYRLVGKGEKAHELLVERNTKS